tara:strand:+ start:661 stop:2241 length:1581 start_codon:yes stop_codon:yes gene_type:complete
MFNNLFYFIKNNKKIIQKVSKNNYSTLLIDRGSFYPAFIASIYSSVLNKKYKNNIITLINDSNNKLIKSFYKSFGYNKIISSSFNLRNILIYLNVVYQSTVIFFKINLKGMDWFINNFKFCNIDIGDIIYDTYIRYNNRYLNPKVDIYFIKILASTLHKVYLIKQIIKKYKVKTIIINQDVYASNGAIALRLGNSLNARVIEPCTDLKNDHFFFDYNKYKVKFGPYNFYYRFLYKKENCIENLKITKKKLNKFLKDRYQGKIRLAYTGKADLFSANKKKNLYSRQKLLKQFNIEKENKINKIVVLACHSFSDAPHGQGKNIIFKDYYEQVKETLLFLEKNIKKNILWIIRPHPAAERYGEQGIVEGLYKKTIKHNKNLIKISPKNLDTKNLIQFCDFVVTMKGTIGLEFASEGKHTLCCSDSPYSKLGISLEVNSKKKYFKIINKIHKFPKKISTYKTNRAKKILYILEKSVPENHIIDSKIFTKKILKNRYQNKNLNFFNRELLQKLKMNKIDKDSFYIDLYKRI